MGPGYSFANSGLFTFSFDVWFGFLCFMGRSTVLVSMFSIRMLKWFDFSALYVLACRCLFPGFSRGDFTRVCCHFVFCVAGEERGGGR